MLTFFIFWGIGCIAVALFNARFWQLFPDQEDKQYQTDKSQNISPIKPVVQDTLHLLKIGLVLAALFVVVWLILNAF